MSTKRWSGFSLFCSDVELFAKNEKRPIFYTITEARFINNSRSKQNIKIPKDAFVDIDK